MDSGEAKSKPGRKPLDSAAKQRNAVVREYLATLSKRSGPGRKRTIEGVEKDHAAATVAWGATTDPLQKLKLTQRLLDLRREHEDLKKAEDTAAIEASFVGVVAEYSKENEISVEAWALMGVPRDVLRKAGL